MIWATRLIDRGDVPSVVFLLSEQIASFDPGRQMMLIGVDEEWPMIRLWVAVPDPDLLAPYYGFVSCPRRDLPAAPVLLAGDPVRFERMFHGG
ncbi:hypothetical protein MEX01_28550 [Methylorubrum extorquens]|uniref:hypothetical protein n=1 Tax=Methylorubrum extorquens TaxID=408 RepID=UPI001169407A|nr:hypothetical protein [Methylorubrum extorquens]GEL42264.1 hypothetical protein MEX01_28550 [Methylorubrum extorquens]